MGRNKCSRQIPKNTVNPTFPKEKIMWMLLLNYKYFYLQNLYFHTSAIVLLRNTLRETFMHFLRNQSWQTQHSAIKLSRLPSVSCWKYFFLQVLLPLALFCCFPFITGYGKTFLILNIYSSETWVTFARMLIIVDCYQVQG